MNSDFSLTKWTFQTLQVSFCHGSFWSRGSTWVFQKTRPPSIPEFWNCLWTTCITRWYLNVDPNFKKNKPLQSEVFELFWISFRKFLSPKNPCPQLVPRHLSHLTLLLPLPSHLPLTSSPLPCGHGFGSGAGGAWMGAGGVVLAQWEKVSQKFCKGVGCFTKQTKPPKETGNTTIYIWFTRFTRRWPSTTSPTPLAVAPLEIPQSPLCPPAFLS